MAKTIYFFDFWGIISFDNSSPKSKVFAIDADDNFVNNGGLFIIWGDKLSHRTCQINLIESAIDTKSPLLTTIEVDIGFYLSLEELDILNDLKCLCIGTSPLTAPAANFEVLEYTPLPTSNMIIE